MAVNDLAVRGLTVRGESEQAARWGNERGTVVMEAVNYHSIRSFFTNRCNKNHLWRVCY